ncbi:MAG: transcriptional regulator [Candidatus Lokiarchaeota archaeon]|nr:transcriptional regulator [Candidatus Lokiarchaeota archaeon]
MVKNFEAESCVSADCLIQFLGQKWMIPIIYLFYEHNILRYNQIIKTLEMSPKTLSERLKALTDMGIVDKKIFNEIPPHVEYTLTEKGKKLSDIFGTIESWAETYNHNIIKPKILEE